MKLLILADEVLIKEPEPGNPKFRHFLQQKFNF